VEREGKIERARERERGINGGTKTEETRAMHEPSVSFPAIKRRLIF